MKITKKQLKKIIREEREKLLNEQPEAAFVDKAYYGDLDNIIHEFCTAVDRWFDQNETKLDPKVLDDPNSWAIRLLEMKFDLNELPKDFMAGNRKIR